MIPFMQHRSKVQDIGATTKDRHIMKFEGIFYFVLKIFFLEFLKLKTNLSLVVRWLVCLFALTAVLIETRKRICLAIIAYHDNDNVSH